MIPAAIAQIFNPIAASVIRIEIPSKEAKAEIEIRRVISDAKIRKCSIQCRVVQNFVNFTHKLILFYFFK